MNDNIKKLLSKNEIYHDTHLQVDFTKDNSPLEELIKSVIKECGRIQHERFCEHGDVSWDILMEHFGIKDER